jgi:hypothetical protein
LHAKFLYEGNAPQNGALVFLVPFFRQDNSEHYLVVVYEVGNTANTTALPAAAQNLSLSQVPLSRQDLTGGAQNLSFSPVIEQTLPDHAAINLASGQVKAFPNSVIEQDRVAGNKNAAYDWMESQGIDIANFGEDGLDGLQMVMHTLKINDWEDYTADLLADSLYRTDTSSRVILEPAFLNSATNYTSAFKTRENKLGLMQITGFTDNPRGVKIRYKLVQNGNATGINPAVSPALLADPPKLRYLEWDEDWKTNYPGGVHYPDGSLVTNKQELAWLEYVSPGSMSDVSGQPNLAKQHPHFLHLWFSHPLFDDSFFAEVTLADENGKNPTDPYSSRVAEIKAAEPPNGNFDWLVESLMCGAGTNIPAKVTIRLRYTVGPLEQIQEIPSDYSGYYGLLGGSQISSIGRDAKGTTLVAIGVNPETIKTRQYCVQAVTKDGRKLMSGGGITGNSDGSGPQLSRFYFQVPLSDVAKFIIGTRPIRTNEWKNVVLPKNKATD